MGNRGSTLPGVLIGIALAVAGGALLNYTYGEGIAHHAAWASEHGMPPPARWMFLAGGAALLVGGLVIGAALRSRKAT